MHLVKSLCKISNRKNILHHFIRSLCSNNKLSSYITDGKKVVILDKEYSSDHMTNVTPKILSLVGSNLHLQKSHPLKHLSDCITKFMYNRYITPRGNPLFSKFDQISPVVTTEQNFDSLLVAKDHVTRQKKDNYYVNEKYLLRAHTTAHQAELINMGLDNFLVIGDVYRRDTINTSHYPVFHQADGVRLFNKQDLFGHMQDMSSLSLFDNRPESDHNQSCHSELVVQILTSDLQECLLSLAKSVFGKDFEWRWVDAFFPFTHPSWELEVKFEGEWIELLGCGIIRQEILHRAGAGEKVGWAFGLGLERWAMKMYQIPDIRILWSTDPRFFSQFNFEDPNTPVTFKPFSFQPALTIDISFWLPQDGEFESEDFYDLVRSVGGNLVEKVEIIDDFQHPKTKRRSHCYRLSFRSLTKTLTHEEVNVIRSQIVTHIETDFRGEPRIK